MGAVPRQRLYVPSQVRVDSAPPQTNTLGKCTSTKILNPAVPTPFKWLAQKFRESTIGFSERQHSRAPVQSGSVDQETLPASVTAGTLVLQLLPPRFTHAVRARSTTWANLSSPTKLQSATAGTTLQGWTKQIEGTSTGRD
eukprot:GHVT01045218.1.p2 GENE.GHVT01045218.1~~GHVT01045218.1.p2  ORF type:complete len:141 (+),score=11.62 GHVT01045218.1:1810-2232(+)